MVKKTIGLIVNPVAGLGGRVGLKGSDGEEIQRRARAMGAESQSNTRAIEALRILQAVGKSISVLTYPGEMGEIVLKQVGFEPVVIGEIKSGNTTGQDTIRAAREMRAKGVTLLLFVGGDGTARDIFNGIGVSLPTLGIPAGVKIHSAVYATHPRHAGELAVAYLRGEADLVEAEVVDLDEDAYRQGRVSPQLFGYLKIPYQQHWVQTAKVPSPLSSQAAMEAIADYMVEQMHPEWLYVIGPGSTTRSVAQQLGIEKTLLGVDVILNNKTIAFDVNEAELLNLLAEGRQTVIIVTPIGGQGCIFGRGNQQISPEVIRKVGKEHIWVIAIPEKIYALGGKPLWVDTGDRAVDEMLSGYIRVITGYRESMVIKVTT